jgi:hypothetical protein
VRPLRVHQKGTHINREQGTVGMFPIWSGA